MTLKSDLRELLRPYYLINLSLSVCFVLFKQCVSVCQFVLGDTKDCEFSNREMEILFFLIVIVALRSRKTGSISMLSYLTSGFMYAKMANLVLWFLVDYKLGFLYGILITILAVVVPQPAFNIDDNVTYFAGLDSLENELRNSSKHDIWCVAFYTVWHPSCVSFSPTFSQLSNLYSLKNFKFGKIDIGRYPEAGKKFNVSDHVRTVQLPTMIQFKGGVEVKRAPRIDPNSKGKKFAFTMEELKLYFDLNAHFDDCKAALNKKKSRLKVD